MLVRIVARRSYFSHPIPSWSLSSPYGSLPVTMIGPWTYRGPLPDPPAQSTSGPGGIQGLYPGVHAAAAGEEAWAGWAAVAWAACAAEACATAAAAAAAAARSAAAFAAALSAAAFSAAAFSAAALATAARAAAARAASAWADELLAAARLSAANADAFSLVTGSAVDIGAEVVGATGAAVNAECDPQATVTTRASAHRIAPVIARNTNPPISLARGSFPIP